MYDFKPKKTEEDINKIGQQVQMMQVMGMNRADRRKFSKVNNGIKIPGSIKPIVNKKKE